ncbi:heparan-alpha-glucosaminide N-acetyltransferase domain-containing protein [Aquipuribacter sp. MA13-6]|uniref:heparan-alpha-glucosaminide N-acetyltransferase domain-containing protein n=1 Tax=unclassified Aquipuribacter TaxID=2635084 RepID=UPI003EE84065
MTATTTTSRALPALPRSRRLVGVDAARGLALLGMMAAHLLERYDLEGNPSAVYPLVDGRPSALFAVLAGVGLALLDGGSDGPHIPYRRMLARTAVRAVVILLVGLLLASMELLPVAVILQYYALAFLLLAPLLRLPVPVLAGGGLLWLTVAPFVSHVVRSSAELVGPGVQVSLARLVVDPVGSLQDLFITGYYPVLSWFGYLLVGAAVGRLALRTARTAVVLVGAGLLLGVGAWLVSRLLLATAGARAALAEPDTLTGRGPDGPWFGTTPTSSFWWLAVDTPHSGTPPDLLGTTGSALLVIGVFLLLARTVAGWALLPLAAAGSMTLTLYTAHVVAVTYYAPDISPVALWAAHAAAALVLASAWVLVFRRGPLEAATAALVDMAAGPSRDPAPTSGDRSG